MKHSSSGLVHNGQDEGEKRCLNSELWHACAGPLVSLPTVGTPVVYFPQGHSEQVAASTNKEVDGHIPNYPSLPPQLICQLHNITMHADVETDEVYAQMTLQPLSSQEQKDTYLHADLGLPSRQPTNYFCKTLTASDTSTHGGFSVPRRAAEKVFPPLDFSQQPPVQELIARDLHDVEWKFRHIFRGQPKRHLLTTGWSVFVSAKRLVAGDSILFIWNDKNQLLLGIRRAIRPQTVMPSSVLSTDSMHIGLLAAAAHAASTNSRFTVFYNPRASPSEFVIPLSKYAKAVFHTHVSVGMRFRMLFETEESSVRRYMGTITGIGDLDHVRWPNSQWRSVKVGWDESTTGERQPRVSLWEIEPLTTFPMYPSLFPLRLKRPWHAGVPLYEDEGNAFLWLRGDTGNALRMGPMGAMMQQRLNPLLLGNGHEQYEAMAAVALQDIRADSAKQQFLHFQHGEALHYPQQSCSPNPMLQHQIIQQTRPQQIQHPQTQNISEKQSQNPLLQQQLQQTFGNQQKQQAQPQRTYQETFQIPNGQIQHQQSPMPTPLHENLFFPDSNLSFSSTVTPSIQSILDPNFTSIDRSMMSEQQQQPWVPKFSLSQVNRFGNTVSHDEIEPENFNADSQPHTLFGVNIDSSPLLPSAVHLGTAAIDGDTSTMPFNASGFQGSLYSCIGEPPGFLQSAGQVDPPTRTFVKVYKSGSVGRSVDIAQFSSYNELREELWQMFGLEGHLDGPLRSGWQLVFVDRENDVLLLGDDPWEAFVNNVWYIKILSPDDMQRLGKQNDSLNSGGNQRLNDGSCEARNFQSGLTSVGSLEY